jgi:hypothetical protein
MRNDLDMGVFEESAQLGRGGWIGPEENTWRLDGLHGNLFERPTIPILAPSVKAA